MKWKFGKSYELFYFQVRESPAPLDIPTPTPLGLDDTMDQNPRKVWKTSCLIRSGLRGNFLKGSTRFNRHQRSRKGRFEDGQSWFNFCKHFKSSVITFGTYIIMFMFGGDRRHLQKTFQWDIQYLVGPFFVQTSLRS